MYRIIGIIALAGTLAACPNPTEPQLNQLRKTFDGEYKIILQSGPFRGPLEVSYGTKGKSHALDDSLILKDATRLPWNAKERGSVMRSATGEYFLTSMQATYYRPVSFIPLTQETVYRLEIWIDGTLKRTVLMKIGDDDPFVAGLAAVQP